MRSVEILRKTQNTFIQKLFGNKNSSTLAGFTGGNIYGSMLHEIEMLPLAPSEPIQDENGKFTFVLGEDDWTNI